MTKEILERVLVQQSIGYVVFEGSQIAGLSPFAEKVIGQSEELSAVLLRKSKENKFSDPEKEVLFADNTYYQIERLPDQENENQRIYIIKDVTCVEKEKEKAALYKAYMDAFVDVGVLAIDEHEVITFANKSSYEHDQFHHKEIVGMTFEDFSPEVINSALLQTCRTRQKVENRQMEHSIKNVPRELGSAYPVYLNGEFKGAVSILFFNRWINHLLNATLSLQIEYRNGNEKNRGYVFEDIIGNDEGILKAKKIAARVCNVPSSVLIYGETGTGKELFAQSIHNAGSRAGKPFVGVNCGAIPETLLESTLFGTEKGAFTGAMKTTGLIEQAQGGTLFLDEINSMPIDLQVKLLRVIQEQAYRRVGGTKVYKVNCRILSACNRIPKECISAGLMRDDLYYRLAAVQLNIPPLRDRGTDILLLAENAISHYSEIYGVSPKMSKELKQAFLNYTWPGNVRELNHVIESAMVLLEDENEITLDDMPEVIRFCASPFLDARELSDYEEIVEEKSEPTESIVSNRKLKSSIAEYEKENILAALNNNQFNISRTARELGYSRSNLQYRMKKYDINIKRKAEED